MAESSQENFYQDQVYEDKKATSEILKILNDFITSGKYRIKLNHKKVKLNHRLKLNQDKGNRIRKKITNIFLNISLDSLLKYCVWILLIFFALIPTMYFFQANTMFIKIGNLFLHLLLIIVYSLGFIAICKLIASIIEDTKDAEKNSIFRVFHYNMESYFQTIELLGNNFNANNLDKAEIRFKAVINQGKNNNKLSGKLIPAFSIFIVAIGIYFLGTPNFDQTTNMLFSQFLSISGIIAIINIVWNIYHELLSQDLLVYEQCILILQKAQNIAKDLESKKKTSAINKNIRG